jgi:hypothetical protein
MNATKKATMAIPDSQPDAKTAAATTTTSNTIMVRSKPKVEQQCLKIGSWNIRRGITIREQKLKDVLHNDQINVMF